jgi:multicomponent Na+:H+ antiporter subunit D
VIKIAAFWCAGAFLEQTGRNYLWEIDGVGKKMPVTFTCYTLAGLSLTGIPLFCGFLSKWQLIVAAVDAATPLAVVGVVALILSAFLCAIYMLSVSVRAFFPKAGMDRFSDCTERIEAPWTMLVPIVLLTVVNVVLGIWGQPILSLVTAVAAGQF